MSPKERDALLEIIRTFKSPGDSELDAALNVIASHAATIRRLDARVRALKQCLAGIEAAANAAMVDAQP